MTNKLVISVEARRLEFSRVCPEIERALETYSRSVEGAAISAKKVSLLFRHEATSWTLLPLLSRIEKQLRESKIKYRVTWNRPKPSKPEFCDKALALLTAREVRALKAVRRLPFGGVLIAKKERLIDLLVPIVMGYPGSPIVIVVDRHADLSGVRYWLQQRLNERCGELSQFTAQEARVILTTPQLLRIIPTRGVALLVFLDPPKKARQSVPAVLEFSDSFRVGLTSRQLFPPYSHQREALFGPTVTVSK